MSDLSLLLELAESKEAETAQGREFVAT